MSRKEEVSKSSKETDLAELMERREEQVAVQNAGKVEARKRGDVLEQERAAAEKKMWAEQQKKDNDEKKKRAKEEWQRKLMEEEKRREDKIQFDKSLEKTLEIEGSKIGLRRDMTSAEMDQEFRELNAAQMRVNTRAAVDQIVRSEVNRKKEVEKGVIAGKRMMRTEEGTEEGNRLPPIALMLSAGSKEHVLEPQNPEVESIKTVKEKKGRKVLEIPERVLEEMDVEGGEEDFGIDRRAEVLVEMPLDLPGGQDVIEIEGTVEVLTTTFLQENCLTGWKWGRNTIYVYKRSYMSWRNREEREDWVDHPPEVLRRNLSEERKSIETVGRWVMVKCRVKVRRK